MIAWEREAWAIVNDVEVRGLRLVFKAKKLLEQDPNNLDLKIYNLSDSRRAKLSRAAADGEAVAAGGADAVKVLQRVLQEKGFDPGPIDGVQGDQTTEAIKKFQASSGLLVDGIAGPQTKSALGLPPGRSPVIVAAGYRGNTQIIFQGEVRTIDHVREGPDWVTHVQSGDGDHAFRMYGSASFAGGAQLADVVEELTGQMGVNAADALTQLRRGDFAGANKTFLGGFAAAGRSVVYLDQALKAAGIEWSIQDGTLQLTDPGKATQERAYVLSADSGLVGSPDHGAPGKRGEPPLLKAQCLLNGELRPGRAVRIEAIERKGFCRLVTVEHSGDTHGADWTTSIEGTAL